MTLYYGDHRTILHSPQDELARRLNIDVREVRRMLNPHHGTKTPFYGASISLAAPGRNIELHIT